MHACLQGKHPSHKNQKDPERLDAADRFHATVMDIPALKERMQAMMFEDSFTEDLKRVSHLAFAEPPMHGFEFGQSLSCLDQKCS